MARQPRQFGASTNIYRDIPHFAVPKTRNPDEAARRRELKPGTVTHDIELTGIRVLEHLLAAVDDETDARFAGTVLASAAFGSGMYDLSPGLSTESAELTMRRNLRLPEMERVLSSEDEIIEAVTERPLKPYEHIENAQHGLAVAATVASHLMEIPDGQNRLRKRTQASLGHQLGEAALSLCCAAGADIGSYASAAEASRHALYQALQLEARMPKIGEELGALPSLAQLGVAVPESPLGVAMYRQAPDSMVTALLEAHEEFGIAR